MAALHTHICVFIVALLLQATAFAADCAGQPTRLQLTDGPYENYFYSDCNSSSHVVVTSPLSTSNLDYIYPRLLIAWPAGNSGIVAVFAAQNGQRGTLHINLGGNDQDELLQPVWIAGTPNPVVGVTSSITLDSPAILTVPILGSIRVIREYTEGGRNTSPDQQAQNRLSVDGAGGAMIKRTWYDNTTTTWLTFTPSNGTPSITIDNGELRFGAGTYKFNASFNYPQLTQLIPQRLLNTASTDLIDSRAEDVNSLSFLSYDSKLLAGTWRFLTYFGRDTMISVLLLQSVLSDTTIEAGISSVLERINKTDGTACHEEIIGDFATLTNKVDFNKTSNSPSCDYKMIDTTYYLPVLMKQYFIDSAMNASRAEEFLQTKASFLDENKGLNYNQLATSNAQKIMTSAAPFAKNPVQANLIHLKDGQQVGQWRDSANGLGGGRIPYDVNTALVPAALRAIAALSTAGFFADHPDWATLANQYAAIWEDQTLHFFEVNVAQNSAKSLVNTYVKQANTSVPSEADAIESDVKFYGVALDGNNGSWPIVRVMNTDDCFRHFLLETTNQTQLSSFLNQTADNILRPFPAGLATPVGLFVANPAFGGDADYASEFTRIDYHGTVVWSWPLSMMAAGLSKQLKRCEPRDDSVPDFCNQSALYSKIVSAYNYLWDLIEKNMAQLSTEIWTWNYNGTYTVVQIGAISATESNIRQLWSLTFLAVQRNTFT
ncbi:hypothetical protein K504DRAFT_467975 [Pleomassaria siparia CBS 279.74]|uniref:Glycogen debranching enzyme n=1 Tax=Pleomassaria siparia CBS 279.74 TaxID=1314801 RepID=A0A6G1K8E8_9PLEO|nr:hypothetical protein K504DRAFT_467975 [Pleomassaria siparia CBS 279.74]